MELDQHPPEAPDTEREVAEEVDPARMALEEEFEALAAQQAPPDADNEQQPDEPEADGADGQADAPPAVKADTGDDAPPEEAPQRRFKSHAEAERGYREAQAKMTEATQRAKDMQARLDALEQREQQWAQYVMGLQAQGQGRKTDAPPDKPKPLTKEELAAMMYDEPERFVESIMGMLQGRQEGPDVNAVIDERLQRMQVQQQTQQWTHQAGTVMDRRFEEKYADLKPFEALLGAESQKLFGEISGRQAVGQTTAEDLQLLAAIRANPAHIVDVVVERTRPTIEAIRATLEGQQKANPGRQRLKADPAVTPAGIAPRRGAAEADQSIDDYVAGRQALREDAEAPR